MRIKKLFIRMLIATTLGICAGIAMEYMSLWVGFPVFLIIGVLAGIFVEIVIEVFRMEHTIAREDLRKMKSSVLRIFVAIFIGLLAGTVLELVTLWGAFPVFLIVGVLVGLTVGITIEVIRYNRLMKRNFLKGEGLGLDRLPVSTAELIRLVIKKMRYHKEVRSEVMAELAAHFEDELKDCGTDEEKEQKAKRLIAEFGDAKLLAVLLRRAKKRCRPLWRTVVARTFQTIGVLIVCFIFYAIWFSFGKPTIRIDYVELLNKINQPQVHDQDNAWPHYEKAIELYVPQGPLVKQVILYRSIGTREREDALRLKGLLRDNEQKIQEWLEKNQKYWDDLNAEQKAIKLKCLEYDMVLLYKDAPEYPEYHSDMYVYSGWGATTIEQMTKHILRCIKEGIKITTPPLPRGPYDSPVSDVEFPTADVKKYMEDKKIPPNNLEAVSVAVLREAIKRFKDLPDDVSAPLTDVECEYIGPWIEQNEAAWKEFMAGSAKSYCYQPYTHDPNGESKSVWSILLPHLSSLKDLARMAAWRSRIDRDQGRLQQSIEDCLDIAHAASHLQGQGILIEQLVGLALSGLGHGEILRIIADRKLSAAELQYLQEQLSQIYPGDYPLLNMEGERLAFMDVVQRSFTDGGPGGGHLIPGQWDEFQDFTSIDPDIRDKRFLMPFYTAASMAHARRDATIAKANEIYDLQSKMAHMTPYERHISSTKTPEEIMYSSWSNYRFFLIDIFMPATARVSDTVYRAKTGHEATIAILAILRWRLEKNQYPAALDELVAAGFLNDLPMDPWSDKPLVYKKTEDDFILYSVGFNFKDDGGEYGRNGNGQIREWSDNGDTVFWPQLKD